MIDLIFISYIIVKIINVRTDNDISIFILIFFFSVISIGVNKDTSRSKIIKIIIIMMNLIFIDFFLFFIELKPHSIILMNFILNFDVLIFIVIIIKIIIVVIIIFIVFIIIL